MDLRINSKELKGLTMVELAQFMEHLAKNQDVISSKNNRVFVGKYTRESVSETMEMVKINFQIFSKKETGMGTGYVWVAHKSKTCSTGNYSIKKRKFEFV